LLNEEARNNFMTAEITPLPKLITGKKHISPYGKVQTQVTEDIPGFAKANEPVFVLRELENGSWIRNDKGEVAYVNYNLLKQNQNFLEISEG
jgi:SH3-like domain-containing protein